MGTEDALAVLRAVWPECVAGADVTGFEPGESLSGAAFWRVTGPAGDYCLRRWPDAAAEPGRVEAVHGVLNQIAAKMPGVAPEPVRSTDGGTVIRQASGCWELTRWVPGEADYLAAPSAERRRNAVRLLARVHRSLEDLPIHPVTGSTPGLEARYERLRAGIPGLNPRPPVEAAAGRLSEELQRHAGAALAAVEAARSRPLPLQWCVRDARAEHVLFDGEQAVGLVDFGAAGVDSVAADLARLLRGLAGPDGEAWRQCLTAYGEVRPLSQAEQQAIAVYDLGGLVAAGLNWLEWRSPSGPNPENSDAAGARMAWLADQLAQMPPHPLQ